MKGKIFIYSGKVSKPTLLAGGGVDFMAGKNGRYHTNKIHTLDVMESGKAEFFVMTSQFLMTPIIGKVIDRVKQWSTKGNYLALDNKQLHAGCCQLHLDAIHVGVE